MGTNVEVGGVGGVAMVKKKDTVRILPMPLSMRVVDMLAHFEAACGVPDRWRWAASSYASAVPYLFAAGDGVRKLSGVTLATCGKPVRPCGLVAIRACSVAPTVAVMDRCLVDPLMRRKGVGRDLLRHVILELSQLGNIHEVRAHVPERLLDMQLFLQKMGFAVSSVVRGGDGEDSTYVFRRQLDAGDLFSKGG